MALSPVAEEWVEKISQAASDHENFSSTPSHKKALRDIFEDLERHAGRGAVNQVGEEAVKTAKNGFHPKASRVRERARRVAIREFDADLPAGSTLLKSRNG
jgi:hypothetical protein